MAVTITRSPRYPNVSLGEAVSKARAIYEKEHMSPLAPKTAAEAMGYSGINGASLKTISSLKKYGLLEGRGENVRLTKDAQTLIIDTPDSDDYKDAVRRAALSPDVYSEIYKHFQNAGSERNISVYLEKQGFKPDAAATVARNFKETIALVGSNSVEYNSSQVTSDTGPSPSMEQAHAPAGGSSRQTPARPEVSIFPTDSGNVGVTGAPFRVIQNGKRLDIAASVDLKSLRKLKQMLDTYESILEMLEDSELPETSSKTM